MGATVASATEMRAIITRHTPQTLIFFVLFTMILSLRHYRIERWLGVKVLFRPDAVPPINFFNRSLISYALCKRKRSIRNIRRRFGLEETEQRHSQNRTSSDCANQDSDYGA